MYSTFSFFLEASAASGYLVFKATVIFFAANFICDKSLLDRFSSLIAAWLGVQILQTAVILGLSVFGAMYRPLFLISMLAVGGLIYRQAKLCSSGLNNLEKSQRNYLPAIVMAIVFFGMWMRSVFFYDYTWDAHTYGIPRLAIWLNARSVLIHMPTLQLNLFVNEWNAELNALAYALASGGYGGFAFGNLEILLLLFLSITWLASLLGAPTYWALCVAMVLGSTPAMLGLASTIKGDLLACTAFVITLGWLVYFKYRSRSPLVLALLLLSAALAAGSKISIVLPLFAVLAAALLLASKIRPRDFLYRASLNNLLLVLGLLIFSSRFWINWIFYGNPLKRVEVEQVHFSFAHMVANLELSVKRMFGFWAELQGQDAMWALAGSMGAGASVIIIVAIFAILKIFLISKFEPLIPFNKNFLEKVKNHSSPESSLNRGELNKVWLILVAAAIAISTVFTMTLSEAYQWAFRYFLPGVMALLTIAGALAVRNGSPSRAAILIVFSIFAVLINLTITLRPGEVLPSTEPHTLLQEIREADSPLKRLSIFIREPYRLAGVEELALDTPKNLNILIFKDLETSLIPFLGSDSQNKIQIVDSGKALIESASKPKWDVIAILQRVELRDRALNAELEKQDYVIVADNAQYVIALPSSNLNRLLNLDDIRWEQWSAAPESELQITSGQPMASSSIPADTGFASQEFRFKGPIIVKASFEGEVAGTGAHAAHLSVHSKQLMIALPPGRYSSNQSFMATTSAFADGAAQKLSFGLGGWTTGSGHLRLTKLEVFELSTFSDMRVHKENPPILKGGFPIGVFPITLSILLFVCCAVLGKRVLSFCGLAHVSRLGSGFITGYGLFGLALLLSLRYFDSPIIGALGFFTVFGTVIGRSLDVTKITTLPSKSIVQVFCIDRVRAGFTQPRLPDFLIATVIVTWVVAVALTYLPVGWLADDPRYQLPNIFDLPKHIFAQQSIYKAFKWPPPSPFFSGETFAYNFLFYFPPAFVARIIGNPLINFQTFPLAVLALAIALPMTIYDVVRCLNRSKFASLIAVLLATWAGGLTPLWLQSKPSIGYLLYVEKLVVSQIWIDELFQSAIYVPQHIFAVLCGVVSALLLSNVELRLEDRGRIFFAGLLVGAGCLSSLILIPHLLLFYAIVLVFIFFRKSRNLGFLAASRDAFRLQIILSVISPLILILPFLIETVKWSSGTGGFLMFPIISGQWFYVMAGLGLVLPLAIIGILFSVNSRKGISAPPVKAGVINTFNFFIVIGLVGILFGGYPDAGIKSGLWIRIALIPLAVIGALRLVEKLAKKSSKNSGYLLMAVLIGSVVTINYPTAKYFIQSAYYPIDPAIQSYLKYIRNLPQDARIALFSPEQTLVVLSGRPIDFDFSKIRADSYMSQDGRNRAGRLWAGFAEDNTKEWGQIMQRYDYLIAPTGSWADRHLASKLTATAHQGGYSFYKTKTIQ